MTITSINNIVSSGTAGARPASPALATPASGSDPSVIYYARDTGAVSMWNFNGSAWATISGGTVTSVSLSAPLGGGTVTTSGTLGTTSYTAHGVLIGAGSSALAVTSAGAAGQVLTSNGASADPTFQNGGMQLITEVVTSGSQSTVSFSSIPATYRDLILRVRGAGSVASSNTNIQIQFNGDTNANYDCYSAQINNSAPGVQINSFATTLITIGYLAGSTAPANISSSSQVTIFDYRGTTFYKNVRGTNSLELGTSAGNMYFIWSSGYWKNTAAINAVLVSLASGHFIDGSVVSLYGSY